MSVICRFPYLCFAIPVFRSLLADERTDDLNKLLHALSDIRLIMHNQIVANLMYLYSFMMHYECPAVISMIAQRKHHSNHTTLMHRLIRSC